MLEKTVRIKNETGIHARPASLIVENMKDYDAEIQLVSNGSQANAKSIMGIMSLGVSSGTEVSIKAEGVDAQKAVDCLLELIETGFGE